MIHNKPPRPEQEGNSSDATRHPLEIALASPVKFVATVGSAAFVLVAIILLGTFVIAEFLVRNDVVVPGFYTLVAKTNQVVVPAAAGWVAVNPNPDEAFKKDTKLKLTVTG